MDPEFQPPLRGAPAAETAAEAPLSADGQAMRSAETAEAGQDEREYRGLRWAFIGSQGLRAGWSALFFFLLLGISGFALELVFSKLHLVGKQESFTAPATFFSELAIVLALVATAALVALLEGRSSVLVYNLTGPRRLFHFLSGLVAGFAALSALVGALAWGGWMHFGHAALSGAQIFKFGALWAAAFLLVGCCEEGVFRCYLLFTFARGINFWWALAINALVCGELLLDTKGNGAWGVYAVALLGLAPCLILHIRKTPRSGFWQAAWVTSMLFGFIHTGNNGEDWIGIFAAALIGFVFCVSVRVTGSAWWAIGCHAAWDWSETYFYGAIDSGNVATGHYQTTTPAGNVLWSGGADGPEGSLLVLGVALLLLMALLVLYGRKKPVQQTVAAASVVL